MEENTTPYVDEVDYSNRARVIIRCRDSGVVIGEIIHREGSEAIIRHAQVLWGWEGANTLMEIANSGLKRDSSKLSQAHYSDITVMDVIQVIPIRDGVDLSPCWS